MLVPGGRNDDVGRFENIQQTSSLTSRMTAVAGSPCCCRRANPIPSALTPSALARGITPRSSAASLTLHKPTQPAHQHRRHADCATGSRTHPFFGIAVPFCSELFSTFGGVRQNIDLRVTAASSKPRRSCGLRQHRQRKISPLVWTALATLASEYCFHTISYGFLRAIHLSKASLLCTSALSWLNSSVGHVCGRPILF